MVVPKTQLRSASLTQQYAALLRRLWLSKRRRLRQTTLEALAPALFASALVLSAWLGDVREGSQTAIHSNLPPWRPLVSSERYAAVTEYYTFARRHACATTQLALAAPGVLPHGAGARVAVALGWDLRASGALARTATNRLYLSSLRATFGTAAADSARAGDGDALVAAAAVYLGLDLAVVAPAVDALADAPLSSRAWERAADALAVQLRAPPTPGAPISRLRQLLRAQSLRYKGPLPLPSLDEFVGLNLLARAALARSPAAARLIRLLRGLGYAVLGNLGALGGLAFVPDTPGVRALADTMALRHQPWWTTYFAGIFPDAAAAVEAASAAGDADAPGAWAVVEFDEATPGALHYRIRMRSLVLPDTSRVLSTACGATVCGDYKAYLFSGFLSLMRAIDAAALDALRAPGSVNNSISAERRDLDAPVWVTPFPSLHAPELPSFFSGSGAMLGIVMSLGMAYPLACFARALALEAHGGALLGSGDCSLRSLLLLGGASRGSWTLTWALAYGVVLALGAGCAAVVLSLGLYVHSPLLLLWALLTAFAAAVVPIAFIVAELCVNPASAAIAAPAVLLVLALPRLAFGTAAPPEGRAGAGLAAARAACLLPSTALGFAGDALAAAEQLGTRASPTLQECVLWLLLDAVIYVTLAVCCTCVRMPRSLVRQLERWGFWIRLRHNSSPLDATSAAVSRSEQLERLVAHAGDGEFDGEGGTAALVKACGVRRVLPGGVVALASVDLMLREREVVALVGANGAGKSTLLRVLAGLAPLTAGRVVARGRLGLCPQASVLTPWLTVSEHLHLFAALRRPAEDCGGAVAAALHDARLGAKADTRASALSGGQQRRLQLACTLVGSPDVLLLDEPCAGLDPPSRRRMFAMLRDVAVLHDRAILMTTHYAHELEGCIDRVEVLVGGSISSCDPTAESTVSGLLHVFARVSPQALRVFVAAHAPAAMPFLNDDGEPVWRFALKEALPNQRTPPSWLAVLLAALESEASRLGIFEFRVTTEAPADALVPLKSCNDEVVAAVCEPLAAATSKSFDNDEPPPKASSWLRIDAVQWCRIVRAMLRKRVLCAMQDWRALLLQLALPVLTVMAMLLAVRASAAGAHVGPQLKLSCRTLLKAPGVAPGATMDTPVWWQNRLQSFSTGMSPAAWFAAEPGGGFDEACGARGVLAPAANSTLLSLKLISQAAGLPDAASASWRHGAFVAQDVELPRFSPGWCIAGDEAGADASGASAGVKLLLGLSNATAADAAQRQLASAVGAAAARTIARLARPGTNVLFNSTSPHAVPILLSELQSVALAQAGGPASRSVMSHPLPLTADEARVLVGERFRLAIVMLLLPLAYPPAAHAAFAARERASGAAAAQRRAGAGAAAYWASTLAAELVLHACAAALVLMLLAAFGVDALAGSAERACATLLLLLAYGAAAAPFSACVTLVLVRPPGAAATPSAAAAAGVVAAVACANFATGFGLTALDFALRSRDGAMRAAVRARLVIACRIFPPFALGEGLLCLVWSATGFTLDARGEPVILPPGSRLLMWQLLGEPLVVLTAQCVGYAMLAVAAEAGVPGAVTRVVSRLRARCQASCATLEAPHARDVCAVLDAAADEGVTAEKVRLQSRGCQDLLAARALCKTYRAAAAPALSDVWLGVRPGERLALLGANAAGKSTLLALLCGAAEPSSGTVKLGADGKACQAGVCPQHNPLLPALTCNEHLQLHARLWGVPEERVSAAAAAATSGTGLGAFIERRAGELSGGAQRKLTLALARVGNPHVLLCDEPSSGLDARSRHAMWDALAALPVRPAALPHAASRAHKHPLLLSLTQRWC